MLGVGRAESPGESRGPRHVKSRKTQLGMPDPGLGHEAGKENEGPAPASDDRPALPDLPVAPTSGGLPPPGGEGLSLAGVVPSSTEPARAEQPSPARHALSLEERVQRLEDVVATFQLSNAIHPASSGQAPAPPEQASLADFIASAAQNHSPPPAESDPPATEHPPRMLPFEMLAEVRVMLRMYLDPRYRLTWQTRVLPPLYLFGMFLSWLLISGIPVVGFLFDRVIFLVLAYMLFKVLIREATRYRMTSPDLPFSLRL